MSRKITSKPLVPVVGALGVALIMGREWAAADIVPASVTNL